MNDADRKVNEIFAGLVVRKDLAKEIRGNLAVPNYVLEYLLGQYCATAEEEDIKAGVEQVKEILRQHFVRREESELVKSKIRESGSHKVIDKVQISLNTRRDVYEADFANLGIKGVPVDADTVKRYPKLLVNGVWCIVTLSYYHSEDTAFSPWQLESLKPIQQARFDEQIYLQGRNSFTTEEWKDLLIRTIGFEPDMLDERKKMLILTRLIPFCERNYNLIELGPKGTGKSHIYSDFSPHGILLSGSEVSVPKLFVNNSTGRIGLVGFWDCVAFDEFAGKVKSPQKELVDIMKNYMANKSFSRGIDTLYGEASFAFEGNTSHNVPYLLRHADLFDDLPAAYHDSAFLDRLHSYNPGWEADIIRGELFTEGYGFIIDYLAEALRNLRGLDYSNAFEPYFKISSSLSTRDKDGVRKTFSGLMKVLYPDGKATKEEMRVLLEQALEGRKRVKDQLLRIDSTFEKVSFSYTDLEDGSVHEIKTREELQYPQYYEQIAVDEPQPQIPGMEDAPQTGTQKPAEERQPVETPKSKYPYPAGTRIDFEDGQLGFSYEKYFGPYLDGAKEIQIVDPYVRLPYQFRNLIEFLQSVIRHKDPSEEVIVTLTTGRDYDFWEDQKTRLETVIQNCKDQGIDFDYKIDEFAHARDIETDTGWKITLDRGLDVFQNTGKPGDMLSFYSGMQEIRPVKKFYIFYTMNN